MEEFSIEKQFEKCKICLNRKSDYHNIDDVCNIMGMQMDFTDYCESFDLDKSAQQNNLLASGELKLKDLKDVSLKPSQSRAKFAIGLIWLVAIIDMLAFSIYSAPYFLFWKLDNREELAKNSIDDNAMLIAISFLLFFISFIISAVFFIKWLLTIYENLEARGVPLKYPKNIIILAWFVPILNFYRPFQILKDLFSKTIQLIKLRKPDYKVKIPSVIAYWWALWLFLVFLLKFGSKLLDDSAFISLSESTLMMSYFALHVLLAFTTVKMIKSYMRLERKLLQLEEKDEITFAGSH